MAEADPLTLLVSAVQAEPSRLTQQLAAQFGAAAVTQVQTVRLQATGDCAGLAAALLKSLEPPAPPARPAAPAGSHPVAPAWVVLTSPGGIHVVWQELRARGLTPAHLQRLRYAVVGDATADALRAEGLEPAYISGHATTGGARGSGAGPAALVGAGSRGGGTDSAASSGGARALTEGLATSGLIRGATVHVLQSNRADSSVWAPLQAQAATLKRWVAYRSDLMPENHGPAVAAFKAGQFRAAAFTSGSSVEGLYAVTGAERTADTTRVLKNMKVFSIGPTATRALQAYGVLQVFDAPETTVASLVETIRKHLAGG